jgi:aminocarboxymuconate-semialdehyde decarboxylase
MAERIDAFAHVLPRPFYEELRDAHPTDELAALDDANRFWDMSIRLDDMDEFGIDKQVITLARPPIWQGLDPADALELVQLANDEVARIGNEHDRLIPVGTLPFVTNTYLAEYDRCVEDLDMAGVQIFSNVDGQPIDGPEFRELYARSAEKGTPVWLHPQLHEWHEWDSEYMLHKILGWPFDTTLAMARLVFSGITDEYPDLTVIPHHMGAMVPHFTSRIGLFHRMLTQHRDVYPYRTPKFEGDVVAEFRQFYADTCRGGDASILEDGVDFFGDDRLVFATDYPFGPDRGRGFMSEEVQGVQNMDVSEAVRDQIFGENFRTLIE